jgi:hypothetical protein
MRTWFSKLGSTSYVLSFASLVIVASDQRRLPQDMDLLNENRSLIHTGKFLRQPETGFEWNGWTELFALLFDNYRMGLNTLYIQSARSHPSNSCHDETQGEGWSHEIPSVPTGNSRPISQQTTSFLTCCVAHPTRPSHPSDVHRSSDPTRWQTIGFR